MPLADKSIAVMEGRQLEELAPLLEAEGATVLRCPLIRILDVPDEAPVLAWLHLLAAGRFDWVVLFTGEGLLRLLACADRHGLREASLAGLRRAKILTRGPKPVQALKSVGLAPAAMAAAPTTDGVIAALRGQTLRGLTVGVQLYSDSNQPLAQFLEEAGAAVHTVQPYIYAPNADATRVGEILAQMAQGTVSAVVFTSSMQVDRLFEVAAENNLQTTLVQGLERTRVAAVGPLVAETLSRRGVRVDIAPEQGFVMKNLVQHIKRFFRPSPA